MHLRGGLGHPARACTPRAVAGDGPDTVLLLEHPPVYTAGKRTEPQERPTDGTPVVDVDRGGKITWHGPGPAGRLPDRAAARPVDVVAYVRRLEEALIAVCAELGLTTGRVEGRSGVWVRGRPPRPGAQVAAIGIRVARGVTMHGFALNCDNWPVRRLSRAASPTPGHDAVAELGRDVRSPRRSTRSRRRCAGC